MTTDEFFNRLHDLWMNYPGSYAGASSNFDRDRLFWDMVEKYASEQYLEGYHDAEIDAARAAGNCNCGFGGFHEETNPNCRINQED